MKHIRLWWQLKRAGSSKQERAELLAVSRQLQLGDAHLDPHAKEAIAQQIGFKPVHLKRQRRFEMASAFALLVAVIVVAQFAHPGSPLYALKRGTQNVRAVVQPSYRQELEQEREQEQEHERTNGSSDEGSGGNRHGNDDGIRSNDDSGSGSTGDKDGHGSSGSSGEGGDNDSSNNESGSGSGSTSGSGSSGSSQNTDNSGSSGGSSGTSGSGGHGSDD